MRVAKISRLPLEPAAGPLERPSAPSLLGDVQVQAHLVTAIDKRLWNEWQDLSACASEANSFAEPWFVDASLRTVRRDREIWLLQVRHGERLIGVMTAANELFYGRLPVIFTQNWCHHQMFLATPMVRAGDERLFWTAILRNLDSSRWAWSFLHLRNLVEDGPVHRGLQEASLVLGRSCSVVHRRIRAFLQSDLTAELYLEQSVRQKKRKELRRLRNRLTELGDVRVRRLESEAELDAYCDAFLAMEQAGWKGHARTALASRPENAACFREVVQAAWSAGRLQFLRLDLDGRPIAMLVNLLSPPGSFSYKTCFDEAYARFSPGVLLQIENLAILERDDIAWMDSCALDHHPMIDRLWGERRSIVRVTVPLAGARRRMVHAACRSAEEGMARLRSKLA